MESASVRNKVFISYSHKDKEWLDRIQTMLKPEMRKSESLIVWADTRIEPGDLWKAEIFKALSEAKVAVLLVSKSFLASDFIDKHELPPILAASEKEGLKILWIAIDYCLYENTEISRYQSVGNPSEPLSKLPEVDKDRTIKELCQNIVRFMEASLHPSLPDYDEELGEALSGIIQAAPSPYGTKGILRRYKKGTIYLITEKGVPIVKWPKAKNGSSYKINDSLIGRKYEAQGGTGSKLGFPLENIAVAWESKTWDKSIFNGYVQWFEGGRIYQSPRFGAHNVLEGNIFNKFAYFEQKYGNKMTGGRLGFPISDQYEIQSITGAKGTIQRFIYGYIVDWSGGTYAVEMGFYDIYQAIGEWNGDLGFPLSDEQEYKSPISSKVGVIQSFENGCMHWDFDVNRGFFISGEIYQKWLTEKEKLGFAINYPVLKKYSTIQIFEGGIIEKSVGGIQVLGDK